MKKLICLFIATTFFLPSFIAQKKVVLHSQGTVTVFGGSQPFVDAYNAASTGDTLYLPGGQLSYPNQINKGLKIFGAGHHPDSSLVTGNTILPSGITIQSGADNLHLEGLQILGSVTFTANTKIDSVQLQRCFIQGNVSISGTSGNLCNGLVWRENIMAGTVNMQNTSNLVFHNNIVKAYSASVLQNFSNNAWLANNIIVGRGFHNPNNWSYHYQLVNITDCLFENNIIHTIGSSYTMNNVSNNTFLNNIFTHNHSANHANVWSGNFFNIDIPTIFHDFGGNSFDYAQNYALLDPTAFIGTSGNEVGIYGGLQPGKTSKASQNPRFLFKQIAPQTNSSGELSIEISVEAQNE
jgi:hypothetical protein